MKQELGLRIDLHSPVSLTNLRHEHEVLSGRNLRVALLGKPRKYKGAPLSAKDICRLYREHGERLYTQLDGCYTVFIADFERQTAYVFQDYFGCNQTVYYYKSASSFYVSSRLKTILDDCPDEWEMHMGAVRDFIRRGYCTGSRTLIEGVHKIPGRRYLKIDLRSGRTRLLPYRYGRIPRREISFGEYDAVVERQCLSCAGEHPATTISSGYDSNYILHHLRKNLDGEISAFCIGGCIGRNEIPDAKKICAGYENVSLHTRLVDGSSLSRYPEIVYILEGSVYEMGVFLQYELARLARSEGCDQFILGECADQVLNYEIHHPVLCLRNRIRYTLERLGGRIRKGKHFRPYRSAYEMGSFIVAKKNGITLNHFGIEAEYPYIHREFMETARNAVKVGERSKEFHKKVINSILPESITEMLKKIGGSTELKALFTGDVKLRDLRRICMSSPYYQPGKKFNDRFYCIDNILKIIYLELFRKIFIEQRDVYLTDEFGDYDLKHFFPELEKQSGDEANCA